MSTGKLWPSKANVIVPYTVKTKQPAGTIISYAGSIAAFTSVASADSTTLIHKDGWAVCNGASIAKATYAELVANLAATWNTAVNPLTGSAQGAPADTATNFRIPNLQGVFLRGVGAYTGADAYSADNDVALAGFKVDKGQDHTHAIPTNDVSGGGGVDTSVSGAPAAETNSVTTTGPTVSGLNGTPRTGKETNPKQMGVYYLVKLFDGLADASIYIEPASATNVGLVTTGAQEIAGAKKLVNTTDSTTKDTGCLILEGGLGVEKAVNIGGVLTANLGIKLNTAAGQLALDSYTYDGITFYVIDGAGNASTVGAMYYTRIGNLVIIQFPEKTLANTGPNRFLSTNSNGTTKAWPAVLTPTSAIAYGQFTAIKGAQFSTGLCSISTGGTVTIYPDLQANTWGANDEDKGVFVCTMMYLLQ